MRLSVVCLVAVLVLSGWALTTISAQEGLAHRASCHRVHSCPSDHATYRWGPKRLLCVKPTSDERTARFKIRIRYGGFIYWCRR